MRATPTPDRDLRRRWWRRLSLAAGALLIVGLLSAWPILARWLSDPLGQPAAVGVSTVVVDDDVFTPSVISVPVGTTVTFDWAEGSGAHDVVFEDGPASPVQSEGRFERHVTAPGELLYRCTLHPFMAGRVEVPG